MAEPTIDVVGVLDWLWGHLGAPTTTGLIFAVPVAFVAWQVWSSIRKDRKADAAIAAKEETIQRMADENRLLRIRLAQREWAWTAEEIDAYIIKGASRIGETR